MELVIKLIKIFKKYFTTKKNQSSHSAKTPFHPYQRVNQNLF